MSISRNELVVYKKMVEMGEQVNGKIDQRFTQCIKDLKQMANHSGFSFSQIVKAFVKGEI